MTVDNAKNRLSAERLLGITGTPETNPLCYAAEACKKPLKMVALFSCAINLLLLVSPIFMMQVYDRVLNSGSIETLVFLTLIAIFLMGMLALFELVRGQVLVNLGEWAEAYLSPGLFERALNAMIFQGGQPTEALRDLTSVRTFLTGPALLAVMDTIWIPIFIVATFLLHWVLGVLAVASAALLLVLAWWDEISTRAPLERASEAGTASAGQALAAARNAELIEAMGMTDAVRERWFEQNRVGMVHARHAALISKQIVSVSRFCRLVVYIIVLAAGAWLALRHQVTSGVIVGASIIVSRALAPIEQAISVWRQLVSVRLSLRRLNARFIDVTREETTISLPAPAGRLTVQELSYAPRGSARPILRNVNFDASPGEFIAVIGPSGSGKSTLARLLVGIYPPTHGSVRMDAAEISRWRRNEFGRYAGYLPQSVQLLPGTIRDNICRMRDDASVEDEDIIAAAKMAGIHEMVLKLPNGYDTIVGVREGTLSGGQRQRIGLALALFGMPKFLVLDEPDANLDTEGEMALMRALVVLKEAGTTVIVISHKISLIDKCDKILVMQDGVGVMFGPRDKIKAQLAQLRRPVDPAHSLTKQVATEATS